MKCYVYAIKDPDTDEIFYVGKGSGYRMKSHLKPSTWKDPKSTTNPFLYYKIRSIFESGKEPLLVKLKDNLTEDEAYEYEYEMIEKYGRRFVDGGSLFNISGYKGGSELGRSMPWSEDRKKAHKDFWKSKRVCDDENDLRRMYIDENMTRLEIADHYGVSEPLVKKRLKEYDIRKPDRSMVYEKIKSDNRETRECGVCERTFVVTKSNKKKYCNRGCADLGRRRRISFKGVEYESVEDAHIKTKYSIGYISNVCIRL